MTREEEEHKLVHTGSHPVPVYTNNGVIIKRRDTKTALEEAANMIVPQLTEEKASQVRVVVDGTDIFFRLLHFCCHGIIPTSTCLDVFANLQSCCD